jgi:hypothetical protein
MRTFLITLLIAFAVTIPAASASVVSSTCGAQCGGGGYSQLPTCNSYYLGVTLYVQGYYWRCVANPYHWVIV